MTQPSEPRPRQRKPRSFDAERSCTVCATSFVVPAGQLGRKPVTCSDRCRRTRQYGQIEDWRERQVLSPEMHGTSTGYSSLRCRCDLCRKWMRDYRREKRLAERE